MKNFIKKHPYLTGVMIYTIIKIAIDNLKVKTVDNVIIIVEDGIYDFAKESTVNDEVEKKESEE